MLEVIWVLLGDLFGYRSLIHFGMHFDCLLVPFWALLGSYWVHLAPFASLLAPFWFPLPPFGILDVLWAAVSLQLAIFWRIWARVF